jgi:hypothetical protein
MKKLIVTLALLVGFITMESFYQKEASSKNDENKIGVWKTYEDYSNGILTDMGAVTENTNSWKDHGIFFAKGHVMPETTKYWGARIPQFEYKKGSFVHHDLPQDNTSLPVRFFEGKTYHIMVSPMPIGIFYRGGGKPMIKYDDNGDVIDLKNLSEDDVFFYVCKGKGPVVRTHEREETRAMFKDDPEILKDFDNDETFKGHIQTSTKQTIVFIKYVMKYNKKHTPGYISTIKEYRVKK